MGLTNFPNGVESAVGFFGPIDASVGSLIGDDKIQAVKKVVVTVTDGAAATTFAMPANAFVSRILIETPTAIPGTPTNTNIRLGSAANGQQYVADVDAKGQGVIDATIVYAGRNPATTVHVTVASSGGTASAQDGTINLYITYAV